MEMLTVSTSNFAGIPMVMGVDAAGATYVKAVDVQNAIGKPDNSYRDFLAGKSLEASLCMRLPSGKNLLFYVPGYNKPVAFIPTKDVAQYWIYQSNKGNKLAQALITADLAASLERQAKETNNIQVTAAQHEELRSSIRTELIQAFFNVVEELEKSRADLIAAEDDSVSKEEYYRDRAKHVQVSAKYKKAKLGTSWNQDEVQVIISKYPHIDPT